jgi:hypothetical protein
VQENFDRRDDEIALKEEETEIAEEEDETEIVRRDETET